MKVKQLPWEQNTFTSTSLNGTKQTFVEVKISSIKANTLFVEVTCTSSMEYWLGP